MSITVRSPADKDEIYAFLRRDPVYAAYAIGDLEAELFAACTWRLAVDHGQTQALALVYWQLSPPVLLTIGETAGLAAIFQQTSLPGHIYMNARLEHLPLLAAHYDFSADRIRPMLRMSITGESFRPAQPDEDAPGAQLALRRLGPADARAMRQLYAHGGPFAPDAFSPAQLVNGVYFGLEAATHDLPSQLAGARSMLAAVAGTHLVAPTWGVAAVGNVYTHPACRGQGYAQVVASAVTAELLRRRLLVVLNVDQDNAAAIHVYEKLGYWVHGPFVEGIGAIRNT